VTERQNNIDRAELRQAFGSWMEQRDDSARARARELGRRALASGVPLLELVDAAMGTITADEAGDRAQMARLLDAGHEFVHECISPYDDALRQTSEGNRGLRQRNDHMEEQVRRIAHEIHDSSAQFLASVHTELERTKEEAPGELVPRLQKLHTLLNQVEVDLRRFAQELRPTILDDLGLVPALHELARSLGRNGMIVTVDGPDERFPSAIELALYRTVQEALAGAGRHDRARRVKVKVESNENEIRCSIADDGSGVNSRSSASQRGLGLFGIRERLAALGGTLVSENRSDSRGTRLIASLPLEVSHVTSRFDR
jgi:signal transduction histidine kinase